MTCVLYHNIFFILVKKYGTTASTAVPRNRRLLYLLTVNFPHHPHRNLHPDQTLLHDS